MLKTLQKSVEEEEMVWRTQILESEDKRKMVGLYTDYTVLCNLPNFMI